MPKSSKNENVTGPAIGNAILGIGGQLVSPPMEAMP